MKKEYITIYNLDGREYMVGFDYANLKNINMGIDSKMGYYEVDDEIRNIIHEKNLQVKYLGLSENEKKRIRHNYFDEVGDTLRRIERASLVDLMSWKKSIESVFGTELYNEVVYNMILNEVKKRNNINKQKDEVLDRMMIYMDILKDEFGSDLIMECLSELPNMMQERINSRKSA